MKLNNKGELVLVAALTSYLVLFAGLALLAGEDNKSTKKPYDKDWYKSESLRP